MHGGGDKNLSWSHKEIWRWDDPSELPPAKGRIEYCIPHCQGLPPGKRGQGSSQLPVISSWFLSARMGDWRDPGIGPRIHSTCPSLSKNDRNTGDPTDQELSTFQEPPFVCSVDSLTPSLKGGAIIPTLQVWKLRLSETKISHGIIWLENAVAGIITQAVRPQDPAFVPCKNIFQKLIVQTSDVL